MKKVLLLMVGLILSFNISYCEEIDYIELVKCTTMPTDEQIMETIQMFNFDKDKEQYLFEQTKKTLKEMYENNAPEKEPEVKKTDKNINMPEPQKDNPEKQ